MVAETHLWRNGQEVIRGQQVSCWLRCHTLPHWVPTNVKPHQQAQVLALILRNRVGRPWPVGQSQPPSPLLQSFTATGICPFICLLCMAAFILKLVAENAQPAKPTSFTIWPLRALFQGPSCFSSPAAPHLHFPHFSAAMLATVWHDRGVQ